MDIQTNTFHSIISPPIEISTSGIKPISIVAELNSLDLVSEADLLACK